MAKTQILRVKNIEGICGDAREQLDALFPKGIPLVPSSVDRIVEAGLDPTEAMSGLIPAADLLMQTPEWGAAAQEFSRVVEEAYNAKRVIVDEARQKKYKVYGRLMLKALLEARTKGG